MILCVYTHACVCARMHQHTHTHTHTHTNTVHARTHTHMPVRVRTHARTYVTSCSDKRRLSLTRDSHCMPHTYPLLRPLGVCTKFHTHQGLAQEKCLRRQIEANPTKLNPVPSLAVWVCRIVGTCWKEDSLHFVGCLLFFEEQG